MILLSCLLADWLFKKLGMPGLVGMLIAGALLGPTVLNAIHPSLLALGADLRMIAFIVVLLRAGFELSRKSLGKIGFRALLVSVVPALFETGAALLLGPPLFGLTLLESALLGCVLGGVSPAIVVPMMARFNHEKRGTAKAIPALVLAGASVGNVLLIVGFGILMGLYSGTSASLAWKLAGIPVGIVSGLAVGLGFGFLLCIIFDRYNPRATKRALILLGLSIALVTAGNLLESKNIPFSGLLAVMAIGFIILEKREKTAHELSAKLSKIWIFAEIILFAMVGAQVNFAAALDVGLNGMLLIVAALAARSAGVWLCLLGRGYSVREKLFVVISNIPKATVQATIGAAPLALMTAKGFPTGSGEVILTLAVMSILITAPLGAWAIEWAGRHLLIRETNK